MMKDDIEFLEEELKELKFSPRTSKIIEFLIDEFEDNDNKISKLETEIDKLEETIDDLKYKIRKLEG